MFSQTFIRLLKLIGTWTVIGFFLAELWNYLRVTSAVRRGSGTGKRMSYAAAVLLGSVLPACGCIAMPFALSFQLRREEGNHAWLLLFLSASYLSPAVILLGAAYLGAGMTAAYLVIVLCMIAGILFMLNRGENQKESAIGSAAGMGKFEKSDSVKKRTDFFQSSLKRFGDICFALLFAVFLQALLDACAAPVFWRQLTADPEAVSWGSLVLYCLDSYFCMPDEMTVAAALQATGLSSAKTLTFLLLGILTNLPELVLLIRFGGIRFGMKVLLVELVFLLTGIAAAWVLFLHSAVPHYDLSFVQQAEKLIGKIHWSVPAQVQFIMTVIFIIGCIFGSFGIIRKSFMGGE